MLEIISFCPEWANYQTQPDKMARRYVAEELRRLDRERAPLLRPILATLDDWLICTAIALVREGEAESGEPVVESREWRLRLVDGVAPPVVDPQGRALNGADRGKVLVAKVGNLGGTLSPARPAKEAMAFSGEARKAAESSGRNLYRTVRVTRAGVSLSLDDALTVLRQWGYGVTQQQYQHRPPKVADARRYEREIELSHAMALKSGKRTEEPSRPQGQCNWLVEEVPLAPVDSAEAAA